MLVIPGLNDLHDHLRDMTPGMAEGMKIDDLLRFLWKLSETAGATEYRLATALAAARLLKSGVTSVVDHVYPFHKPGLATAVLEGYESVGIRWFFARGIMTKGHEPIVEARDRGFAEIRALIEETGVDRSRLLVAPVSFRQADVDDYVASRALADELGLRLYTHVAETPQEIEATIAEHGKRPVELLVDVGFAGADTVLVHCVYLSDGEIDALADTGTHVVHCPSNHMKLAKGYTPVVRLMDAGINVALGVDMMVDVFREMRLEVLLQSLHERNPSAITPAKAFSMATSDGSLALGGASPGSIEVGGIADVVCVDMSGFRSQPVLDPLWSLVHRTEASDVTHVIVDGEIVVRDGRLTRVDEDELLAEGLAVIDEYLDRVGLAGVRLVF
jgi:cytosine/adenosine deaminase-related metal-dependent hydrolase